MPSTHKYRQSARMGRVLGESRLDDLPPARVKPKPAKPKATRTTTQPKSAAAKTSKPPRAAKTATKRGKAQEGGGRKPMAGIFRVWDERQASTPKRPPRSGTSGRQR